MKIKEVREMDAKTLAETKENLQEKLAQMQLNHTVTPLEKNLTNNNGPDGNKKFKKNKTGCCY